MTEAKARICIVNYKTPQVTRICLRAIRKFTDYPVEVVVVDNDSQDESVEYLRSLDWIRLIERKPNPGDPRGSYDEGIAYDWGLEDCQAEFYVVMHSDTVALRKGWLTELIGHFGDDPQIACFGSDKIEEEPAWRTFLKKATDFKKFKRRLFPKTDPLGKYRDHNRTICCLYRTDVLKKENLSFLPDYEMGMTSGKKLYLEIEDRGYKTVTLPNSVMRKIVSHLTHATQIANPEQFPLGRRTYRKWSRFINRKLNSEPFKTLLQETSLDK
ncbi:MAG: glycosyltransferase family 2 protein [Planctomycetota bacterium]|jgi:GT2 family glycosyltransferase